MRNISQAGNFAAVSGPSEGPPGRDDGPSPMRYAGLGVQLAVTILGGVLLGQWLDRRLGTEALFTILGAFIGFGATMYSLIRSLNQGGK